MNYINYKNILTKYNLTNLHKANLYGANLYRANLHEADLHGANLCKANLYGANLCKANLYGANLCKANLYGANLCKANLYGANLYGADLYGADLYGADLHNIIMNWTNHTLIAQQLFNFAQQNHKIRMIAGLILISTDWCWNDFISKFSDMNNEATLCLNHLKTLIKPNDNHPTFLN